MTFPRQIIPGRTYLVTRRCTQRQFLLKPAPYTNNAVGYCLAHAQTKTGVQVHASIAMSNHVHHVVTDPDGRLPEFVYIFNKYLAKCMNAHHGRWENFWAGGTQASYVHLAGDGEKIDKFAYAVVNPVAAHLVRNSDRWPGFLEWQPRKVTFKRPGLFFRDGGPMPKTLTLDITPVPLERYRRRREIMECVGGEVRRREGAIRRNARAESKTFLGAQKVMLQRPTSSPVSKSGRRKLSPQVASRDKWRRIELLQRVKEFPGEYWDALKRWLSGARDVVFPPGTYKLRRHFGVQVAEV